MDAKRTSPGWTDLAEKTGLDPLGMQNSSTLLYQSLLPGISNVTLRVRYYGLYPWLVDQYARHIGNPDPIVWRQHIRRAEAIYALVAQRAGGETGVAGVTWASEQLRQDVISVPFALLDEEGGSRYLANEWGVYGAAYASQLKEVGLLERVESHEIPVPTIGFGETLAKCFAPGKVGDLFFSVIQQGIVTVDQLDALASLAPSRLAIDGLERDTYENALFDTNTDSVHPSSNAQSRKKSLQLILYVADMLGRLPSAEDVRWALYSSAMASGECLPALSQDFEAHKSRWWVYQLSDISHVCLETLLRYTLDVLEGYPSGIRPVELTKEVTSRIAHELDDPGLNWSEFRKTKATTSSLWGKGAPVDAEQVIVSRIIKATGPNAACTAKVALEALSLLCAVANKERVNRELIRVCLFGRGGGDARSILTESAFLDGLDGETFVSALNRIVNERVVHRHLWVALAKLRNQGDYTFLIEYDEGKIRLRQKSGPVLTEPRLDTSIRFLSDLRLLDKQGVTNLGRRLIS